MHFIYFLNKDSVIRKKLIIICTYKYLFFFTCKLFVNKRSLKIKVVIVNILKSFKRIQKEHLIGSELQNLALFYEICYKNVQTCRKVESKLNVCVLIKN